MERFSERVSSLPKGSVFLRTAIALARSRGDIPQAAALAERWTDSPAVAEILRSAAAFGTTTDVAWASALAAHRVAAAEFVELLKPLSVLGRLAVRKVPFNISFPVQTGGATCSWLGQGQPAPISALSFASDTLGIAKAGGVCVMTAELARSSAPSAEAVIKNSLLASMAQFLDEQFLDPAIAAVADVSPGSILNGVTPIASSGSTASAIAADIAALFGKLADAVLFVSPALIMTPRTAIAIGMLRDSAGGSAFPSITANGGTLMGVPVIVSANVPGTVSGGSTIVLVDAAEVLYADDGVSTLDGTEEASLQMRDDPLTGEQQLISLWQLNLAAIRIVRYANWKLRRPGAAGYISGVQV